MKRNNTYLNEIKIIFLLSLVIPFSAVVYFYTSHKDVAPSVYCKTYPDFSFGRFYKIKTRL